MISFDRSEYPTSTVDSLIFIHPEGSVDREVFVAHDDDAMSKQLFLGGGKGWLFERRNQGPAFPPIGVYPFPIHCPITARL